MTRTKAIRQRRLTKHQVLRIEALRRTARLLDSAIRIPGTQHRIGWDPIIGLFPGFGDLIAPIFTIVILLHARELGIPRIVQVRMLFNAGLDALVGMVPIAGDLFDFAWKANNRNMTLLERHAYEERPPSASDWLFVMTMILLLLVIAAIPILLAATLIAMLVRMGSIIIPW